MVQATLFSDENAKLLVPAATLLHATIAAAPLNAQELARVGGIEALVALFRRCISTLTPTSAEGDVPYQVGTAHAPADACRGLRGTRRRMHPPIAPDAHPCLPRARAPTSATAARWQVAMPLLRTLALVAETPDCVSKLLADESVLALDDVIRCLHLPLPHMAEAGFEAVAALCIDPTCQARFAASGACWFGYTTLTKYDFTLDEAVREGVEASADSNAQLVANERGRLAVRMLRRLGGYRGAGSAAHEGVRRATARVLTQYLAELLDVPYTPPEAEAEGAAPPAAAPSRAMDGGGGMQLLKLINSASETPYLIWNNHTRAEMLEFVEGRRLRSYASPGSAPLDETDGLTYEYLKEELKVGSVYVRVYTAHPTFPLRDAPDFCTALLEYLTRMADAAGDPTARTQTDVPLALNAMLTLLTSTHQFDLEAQLLSPGRLQTLLSYAKEGQAAATLALALQVGSACCNWSACVEAIGEQPSAFLQLMPLLRAAPPYSEHVLKLLTSLTGSSKVVGAFLSHGAILHALYLFACGQIQVATPATPPCSCPRPAPRPGSGTHGMGT